GNSARGQHQRRYSTRGLTSTVKRAQSSIPSPPDRPPRCWNSGERPPTGTRQKTPPQEGETATPRGPGLTPTTRPDTVRRETLYDKVFRPRPGLRARVAAGVAALADLRGAVGDRGRATGGPGGGLVGGGHGAGAGAGPRAGGGGSENLPRPGGHAARAGPAGRPG